MPVAFLGLGSNLGHKQENLFLAIRALEQKVGLLLKCSSFIETAPWGFSSENTFLNAVANFRTALSPEQLLQVTQQIEYDLGRRDKSLNGNYEDRLIDIDLLFYDDVVLETPRLTLPHPLLHERLFVLRPLDEIAPDLLHPVLHKTIHRLLLDFNIVK